MTAPIKDRPLKRRRNGEGWRGEVEHLGRYSQPRTSLTRGVRRTLKSDGYGRLSAFWCASIMAEGEVRSASFSVGRYGEDGARLLAAQARLRWLVEFRLWRPEQGDALEGGSRYNEAQGAVEVRDLVRFGGAR